VVYTIRMLVLALAACRNIEPAPTDVDGIAHWSWDNQAEADDAAVVDAVENLHVVVDGDAMTDPIDGTLTDLDGDEVAVIGLDDGRDPAAAAGMFYSGTIACPLDDLETVLIALNQDDFFEYDRYERVYTSDDAAYLARTSPTLTWTVELDASLLGNKYTENLVGGMRRVDVADAPHGPILLAHTFLPSPAVFSDGNGSLDQDYQVELYWERAPGEVVHFYALWRQYDWGSGFDQDNEAAIRINLNGLADWDHDTEAICSGR
jgi:hypothetical protein